MTQFDLLETINAEIAAFKLNLDSNLELNHLALQANEAHAYPLLAGGKRVRPAIALLTAMAFGNKNALELAIKPALSLELIHTYSLVHDDLPSMDNDDLRRGKPTVHKVYGEANGLLVGDGLLTQAFYELSKINWQNSPDYTKYLVETLGLAAGAEGMIWGQWLDLACEAASWESVEVIHRNKTGKLIGASFEMGLTCAFSSLNIDISNNKYIEYRRQIFEVRVLIGVAFQITDDLLDELQPSITLGKTAGKDSAQNKSTAVKLLGIEQSQIRSLEYTERSIQILCAIYNDLCGNAKSVHFDNLVAYVKNLLKREF